MSDLQLLEGRFYKNKRGIKVGPLRPSPKSDHWAEWPWQAGHISYGMRGNASDGDYLVSEWSDDPAPVQPIDFSKIKVGDRVRLGGEYEVVNAGQAGLSIRLNRLRAIAPIFQEIVCEHIPADRSIEIGRRVWRGSKSLDGQDLEGVVRFIEGQQAVVRDDNGKLILADIEDLQIDASLDDEAV